MSDITAPAYRIIPIIPALKPGSMEGKGPFVASEKINEAVVVACSPRCGRARLRCQLVSGFEDQRHGITGALDQLLADGQRVLAVALA